MINDNATASVFQTTMNVPVSILQSRNVRIHKRRTSIRLEPEMWDALKDIAQNENCSIHELCSAVSDLKEPGSSFTAALRVFMIAYYRPTTRSSNQILLFQEQLRVNRGAAPAVAATSVGTF